MEDQNLKTLWLVGDDFVQPSPNPVYMRLYGHPLCPYVERSRMTFHLKEIPFQFCCVDFPSRPQWFKELGSEGRVPVLELPNNKGRVIESAVVAQFVDDYYCKCYYQAFPKDPIVKAKVKIAIEKVNSFVPFFYKCLKEDGEKAEVGEAAKPILEWFEASLKSNKKTEYFLDQEAPTFADIFLFPHFTRLTYLEGTKCEPYLKELKLESYPHLMKWHKKMLDHPKVQKSLCCKEAFQGFVKDMKETGVLTLKLGTYCDKEKFTAPAEPNLLILRLKDETFVKPPVNPQYMRLYGHPLCPYVERSRMTLGLKGVPFQFVQIDFPSRPDWFKNMESAGRVPLLELPNEEARINESAVVAQFIDEYYQTPFKAMPEEAFLKAWVKVVMAKVDGFVPLFYKALKEEDENVAEAIRTSLTWFENKLKENTCGSYFLNQKEPTFADIFFFPHFTRLLYFEGTKLNKVFEEIKFKDFPRVMLWHETMKKNPTVQVSLCDKEAFHGFLEDYKSTGVLTLKLGTYCQFKSLKNTPLCFSQFI
eukprot:TRINITY_DN288_c0_g1_i1.p1 TRINITY_DN288_c0_g1~~TRINITY_DN288_c0_g1_i1.p1  ORF type:complete len:533 (+),score=70.47 TRINITY_DN288_c0_g1_i1:1-1599(+)